MHVQNLNSCVCRPRPRPTHTSSPATAARGGDDRCNAKQPGARVAQRHWEGFGRLPPADAWHSRLCVGGAYVHVSAREFSLPFPACIMSHAPREGGARGRGRRRLEGPDGGEGPGGRGSKVDARWRGKRKPGDSCMHGTVTSHTEPCVRVQKAGGERRRRSSGLLSYFSSKIAISRVKRGVTQKDGAVYQAGRARRFASMLRAHNKSSY